MSNRQPKMTATRAKRVNTEWDYGSDNRCGRDAGHLAAFLMICFVSAPSLKLLV